MNTENELAKNLSVELGKKYGHKYINGKWFTSKEAFNRTKSNHPKWFDGISWEGALFMDSEKTIED